MHRSISILISVFLIIVIAGCTAQPTPKLIADFKGNQVYLKEIIYSPELRPVIEQAITDAKVRTVFYQVMQTDLTEQEIKNALRYKVREAGSEENFFDDLIEHNVDWDSERRAVEVMLMHGKLWEHYTKDWQQSELEEYTRANWNQMKSVIAQQKNLSFAEVSDNEIRQSLKNDLIIRRGNEGLQAAVGSW